MFIYLLTKKKMMCTYLFINFYSKIILALIGYTPVQTCGRGNLNLFGYEIGDLKILHFLFNFIARN